MISADQFEELLRVYCASHVRYNFATEEQIQGFVDTGHKCYGRTKGRQVFVVHRSCLTGEMAYSVSDSLAEILFTLVLAGESAGVPLERILDREDDDRN